MDQELLRTLIRTKLRSGRLPYDSIPRVWGGPADGETCDACEIVSLGDELVIEGLALAGGRKPLQLHVMCFGIWDGTPIVLHVECFNIWDAERRALSRSV